MRPLIKSEKKSEPQSDAAKSFWEAEEKAKRIEIHEEQEVFHLTQKEAERCRYEIINQNLRLAECTVHRDMFSNGIRLFPPHLWGLKHGIVYKKVNDEWVKWTPKIRENTKRFEDA